MGGISPANFTALQASGAENDYAIEGQYTPGSTFKLVTATAALQAGLITPGQYYDDTGSYKISGCPAPGVNNDTGCVLHDDPGDGGGTYNISGALTVSSDAFFYHLGDLFWTDRGTYGDTAIQNEATSYGEGTITGIDLPGRGAGPRRQLSDPGQAACGGAQGLSVRRVVVHRRQRRDGVRAGRDGAHSD